MDAFPFFFVGNNTCHMAVCQDVFCNVIKGLFLSANKQRCINVYSILVKGCVSKDFFQQQDVFLRYRCATNIFQRSLSLMG